MKQRIHLFPFRTQKLSSALPKVLYGTLYGRIGSCRISKKRNHNQSLWLRLFLQLSILRRRARNTFSK